MSQADRDSYKMKQHFGFDGKANGRIEILSKLNFGIEMCQNFSKNHPTMPESMININLDRL